jgi:hypothetical protein
VTSAFAAPSLDRAARAPSATPALLRRLRTALVALALLAGVTATLLTIEEHAVISSAGEHTATAVMQAYAARQALADADSQAVQTIPLGSGPSGQYQDDIAAAERSLEQVAENNTAGALGTSALQFIEGLLPTYTGLIEQADAYYWIQASGTSGATGEDGVGLEDLWSASELMHSEILTTAPLEPEPDDSLAGLEVDEQRVLATQRSSPWANPWPFAAWLVTAAATGGTLVAAQCQFSRRLRRVLSKYLTLAAAALIGLCLVTGHVIASEHAFDSAQSGQYATVLALQKFQTASTDRLGQSKLAVRFSSECAQCSAEHEEAEKLANSDAALAMPAQPGFPAPDLADIPAAITADQGAYTREAMAADAGYLRSLLLIIGLTALLVLLIFLGFRRHLDEYRYRSS